MVLRLGRAGQFGDLSLAHGDIGEPVLSRLHQRQQRQDQRILLRVGHPAQVDLRARAGVESRRQGPCKDLNAIADRKPVRQIMLPRVSNDARDYETRLDVCKAMIHVAMGSLLLRRIARR